MNYTTNEGCNFKRYSYLRVKKKSSYRPLNDEETGMNEEDETEVGNPFDAGCLKNCTSFWKGKDVIAGANRTSSKGVNWFELYELE
jgi:hypothetical protein